MHKENIVTSYTFEENRLKLPIAETLDIDFTQGGAKALGDLLG